MGRGMEKEVRITVSSRTLCSPKNLARLSAKTGGKITAEQIREAVMKCRHVEREPQSRILLGPPATER